MSHWSVLSDLNTCKTVLWLNLRSLSLQLINRVLNRFTSLVFSAVLRCVTKSAVKNYPLGYNKLSWAVIACEGFTAALLHYYSHVRIVLMSWQLPKKKKKSQTRCMPASFSMNIIFFWCWDKIFCSDESTY